MVQAMFWLTHVMRMIIQRANRQLILILLQKTKTHKMIEITMIAKERNTYTAKGKDIEVDWKHI